MSTGLHLLELDASGARVNQAAAAYAWVTGGAEPLVAVTGKVSFARLQGDVLRPLAGDMFTGRLVPSADGRVFLASTEMAAPVDPMTPAGLKFTIIEATCAASSE